MNTLLRILTVAFFLVSATGYATAQGNLAQLQAQAEAALLNGEPEQTIALVGPILAGDPDNFAGLFLLALAQAELGQSRAAAATAARAYRAAQTETTRLQSARLAGNAHAAANQYVRAELWLRRAANHITSEQQAETVVRDYVSVRQANPLSTQVNFSIAPSDNINNGSEDEVFRLEGIPFDFFLPPERLALSGTEYQASAEINYRLSQDASQITTLSGFVFGQTYTLSSEARALLDTSEQSKDITGDDFSFVAAEVSLGQQQAKLSPLGPTQFSMHIGRLWRGGLPLANYRDVKIGQDIRAPSDGLFSINAAVREQNSLQASLGDAVVYDLNTAYAFGLPNDDRMQLSLAGRHNVADVESSYEEYRASIGYTFAQPVLDTRWTASLTVGRRTFQEFATTLDGRQDKFATLGAVAVFEGVSYFGFSPSMSLLATRTRSDVEEANSSMVQIRVGVESSF